MTQLFQVQSPGGTWYTIDFDGNTYTVLRLDTTKKGEQVWRGISGGAYFGRLVPACKELLSLGLAERDHQQVMTLVWRMEDWAKRIEAAVAAMETRHAQAATTSP